MVDNVSSQSLLALTASWTAAVRAQESEREDRLFDDPWASALAGADGLAWLEQGSPESVVADVLRTRFFDDYLLRVAREEGVRQVVLAGAGLDTRAFRLEWPTGMKVFELDQGAVLERKQRILDEAGAQPKCERHVVAVDLDGDWETALTTAGLTEKQPAIWLLDGFLCRLSPDDLARLLDRVLSASSPGSYLAFDIINSATLTSPSTQSWVEMQARAGAPCVGTMDDPKALLGKRGWKAQLTQLGSDEANHGRWTTSAASEDDPEGPRSWLVTARRPWRIGEGAPEQGPEGQAGPPIDSGPPSLLLPRS